MTPETFSLRLIFTLVFVFGPIATASPLRAQEAPASSDAQTVADITALVSDFIEHSDQAAKHERFWAEDLVYTSSSAEVTSRKAIMNGFNDAPVPPAEKRAPPKGRFTAEDILVRPYGEAAALTFRLVEHVPDGTLRYFRNSAMFLRRDGRWQAVTWQATKVPEPSAR